MYSTHGDITLSVLSAGQVEKQISIQIQLLTRASFFSTVDTPTCGTCSHQVTTNLLFMKSHLCKATLSCSSSQIAQLH